MYTVFWFNKQNEFEVCPVQHWEEALWLARCRLEDTEYSDMANKYAEHLLTQGMSTLSYN